MTIMRTKPRNVETVATATGWKHAHTGELLVSVGGLLDRLDQEGIDENGVPTGKIVTPKVEIPIIETPVEVKEPIVIEKEKIMETQTNEVAKEVKQRGRPKKQLNEQTQETLPQGAQIIGEVVEYALDKQVIGE